MSSIADRLKDTGLADNLMMNTAFDRIINVTFFRQPDTAYIQSMTGGVVSDAFTMEYLQKMNLIATTITCPTGGLKPDIYFSVSVLPNHICYRMTLRLTNFMLRGDIDIRSCNAMTVEVGYRGSRLQSFTGPIFSSYQESPNPDGITVFEGVVVGSSGTRLLSQQSINLEFHKDSVMIGELCQTIADSLGLKFTSKVPASILIKTIQLVPMQATADNGYAVLSWLNKILHSYSINDNGVPEFGLQDTDPQNLLLLWYQNELILTITGVTEEQLLSEQVTILDCVKSASYSGVILTVQALYDPRVEPSKLIYMDPVFFKGGQNMPNIIDAAQYNKSNGFYRIIKMDIEFDTNGSANNMNLMCAPLGYNKTDITGEADKTRVDEISNKLAAASRPTVNISFGIPQPTLTPDVQTLKSFWSLNFPAAGNDHLVVPNETLLSIAAQYWGSSDKFLVTKDKLSGEGLSYIPAYPEGVPIQYFFPIISIATKRKFDSLSNTGAINPYYVDTDSLDALQPGRYVCVPELSSSVAKEKIHDGTWVNVFTIAEKYYREIGRDDYASAMKDISIYLQYGSA